jgi:hypothetical protein
MALEFTGGDADRVECGSDATLDDITTGTILMWVYIDGFGGSFRWFCKKAAAEFAGYWELYHGNAGALHFGIDYTVADVLMIDNAALSTGQWIFIGASFDSSAVAANQKLWIGDLTTLAAEPAVYATQQASNGVIVTNAAANLKVGNRVGDDRSPDGRIAWIGIWNGTRMIQGQVRDQQFNPHVTSDGNCVLFMHLGFNGTGTQADWSGNSQNNGTVTTATVADHVPLKPLYGYSQPSQSLFPSRKRRRGYTNYQVPAIAP